MDENKRKRDRSNAERRRINALDLNDEEGNRSDPLQRAYEEVLQERKMVRPSLPKKID